MSIRRISCTHRLLGFAFAAANAAVQQNCCTITGCGEELEMRLGPFDTSRINVRSSDGGGGGGMG
ncbi:hypothetical protein, partial [Erythrobacter donghaensis]|uniref:hypothetical protein n=1 Tax=Erythrobacter donghaensis TaxID=267135 RepID=UPI001E5455A0